MNILILHGPNLNLVGKISAKLGDKITLDKINTSLRRHVRNTETTLKIYQTHKVYQAINFIQRNRIKFQAKSFNVFDDIKIYNPKNIYTSY